MSAIMWDEELSSTSTRRTSSKRQVKRELFCMHCARCVNKLIYTHACSFECALALASFDAQQYDYIYTSVMAECMEVRGVSMPRIAPQMYDDIRDADEYWQKAAEELYGDDENMKEFLERRLGQNHVVCKEEVSKRQR